MAREAGFDITIDPTELRCFVEAWEDQLKTFEALVRADERLQALAAPVQPVATLLQQSKENFERNFGSNGYADWIYKDLAELLDTTNAAPVQPVAWMEMVVANLVREGVTKHKARELAEHFYTTPPAAPIPDAITDNSESPEYKAGWNECRELTIQMRKK